MELLNKYPSIYNKVDIIKLSSLFNRFPHPLSVISRRRYYYPDMTRVIGRVTELSVVFLSSVRVARENQTRVIYLPYLVNIWRRSFVVWSTKWRVMSHVSGIPVSEYDIRSLVLINNCWQYSNLPVRRCTNMHAATGLFQKIVYSCYKQGKSPWFFLFWFPSRSCPSFFKYANSQISDPLFI